MPEYQTIILMASPFVSLLLVIAGFVMGRHTRDDVMTARFKDDAIPEEVDEYAEHYIDAEGPGERIPTLDG